MMGHRRLKGHTGVSQQGRFYLKEEFLPTCNRWPQLGPVVDGHSDAANGPPCPTQGRRQVPRAEIGTDVRKAGIPTVVTHWGAKPADVRVARTLAH